MSLPALFFTLLLICLIMALATLSTSMLYAATQILSRCADFLFDLDGAARGQWSRMK